MIGIYLINGWVGATEAGRNVLIGGLLLVMLSVVGLLYLRVRRAVRRVEAITMTAQKLITDDPRARTRFFALDEIGELGATVDYFANHEQKIRRHLHEILHNQSREISELEALFDATARELTSRDAELERLVDQVCSLEFNPFQQRPIELESLVWNVVGELQAQASRQFITIQVMVQRHDQFVLCEEWRLQWALGGLLEAAVRGAKRSEGVSIRLDASEDERYARIDFRASRVSPTRVRLAKRLIESCGGVMTGERGEWRILLPLTADVPFRPHRDDATRQSDATLHFED
jgi:HAMP domain-containing protein